jgi:hypothetical protein
MTAEAESCQENRIGRVCSTEMIASRGGFRGRLESGWLRALPDRATGFIYLTISEHASAAGFQGGGSGGGQAACKENRRSAVLVRCFT